MATTKSTDQLSLELKSTLREIDILTDKMEAEQTTYYDNKDIPKFEKRSILSKKLVDYFNKFQALLREGSLEDIKTFKDYHYYSLMGFVGEIEMDIQKFYPEIVDDFLSYFHLNYEKVWGVKRNEDKVWVVGTHEQYLECVKNFWEVRKLLKDKLKGISRKEYYSRELKEDPWLRGWQVLHFSKLDYIEKVDYEIGALFWKTYSYRDVLQTTTVWSEDGKTWSTAGAEDLEKAGKQLTKSSWELKKALEEKGIDLKSLKEWENYDLLIELLP